MSKYTFWGVLHKNLNIALTEDLSRYSQGETFWKAMRNLGESRGVWIPSASPEECDFSARLKLYQDTGINRVEVFVHKEGGKYSVRCANSRSLIEAPDEQEALTKYVDAMARTSVVNTGGPK